jgi:hypothetical protein
MPHRTALPRGQRGYGRNESEHENENATELGGMDLLEVMWTATLISAGRFCMVTLEVVTDEARPPLAGDWKN